MQTPELKTERLILRPIQEKDTEEIFACWMQDEDVSRYMYWKSSDDINVTKKFVNYELEMISADNWYRWLLVSGSTGRIVGTCLIYYNEEEKDWDISYNLGKEYWGCGYVTEAMRRVLAFAKDELHVKEVIAVHAIENPASGKVIEKLGFQYIKEVPYECNGGTIQTKGKYYRLVLGSRKENRIIRELEKEELHQALELVWKVFQEFEAPDYSKEGVDEFYKSIHDTEYLAMLRMYGAFQGEKLLGVIASRSAGTHIALFFVDGRYHKQGIGRQLFQALLSDNHTKTMTVNSSPYAIPVYHKFGFVDTDKEQEVRGVRFTPMQLKL